MHTLLGEGMIGIRIRFAPEVVVYVKGIVEAHEGTATFFAEHGGEVVLAAPTERATELRALAEDLARELSGVLERDVSV